MTSSVDENITACTDCTPEEIKEINALQYFPGHCDQQYALEDWDESDPSSSSSYEGEEHVITSSSSYEEITPKLGAAPAVVEQTITLRTGCSPLSHLHFNLSK